MALTAAELPAQGKAGTSAAVSQPRPDQLLLSGRWTATCASAVDSQLRALRPAAATAAVADARQVEALDTAGAWLLHAMLQRFRDQGAIVELQGMRPEFLPLFAQVGKRIAEQRSAPVAAPEADPGLLHRTGQRSWDTGQQVLAGFAFVGEAALAGVSWITHPSRIRWRAVLFNIRTSGVDALPIVAILSFLLGVVVAYQAADQLRRFGANIFVADLVGLAMLREFAPLITAIILAGRSGSAYAAQIGTMAVTEEIDAMRTIGLSPMDILVLPKLLALLVTVPLLTVFADILGVAGGMVMAQAQLGVGHADFLERFVNAISPTSYLVGIGKAPVFAIIIALVGCFQGLRTRGGADSVGRQTTRSVVQAIFLVIVADAVFSVMFSIFGL
jgi:phospholipid/cholesterol/gamma-HCH transport system permease protein